MHQRLKRLGRIATSILAVALMILGVIGLNTFLRGRARDARFDRFISHVKSSEALLVTDYGKNQNGKYFGTGILPAPASSVVLPFADFGFRPDDVDVMLNNRVFMADRNQELQKFLDQLHQL